MLKSYTIATGNYQSTKSAADILDNGGNAYDAILGALLTSIYSCRLFFLAFLGSSRFQTALTVNKSKALRLSLIILAILSLFGGLISLDLAAVFSTNTSMHFKEFSLDEPTWLHTVAILTPFVGIIFSWFYFIKYRQLNNQNIKAGSSAVSLFLRNGLGFDVIYQALLVKPYCFIAKLNRRDVIDQIMMLNAWYVGLWHDALLISQSGSLRWYAAAFGLAIFCLIGVVVL